MIRCSAANGGDDMRLGRRVLLATSASSLLLPHLNPGAAQAVQGYIAGRVPGMRDEQIGRFALFVRFRRRYGTHGSAHGRVLDDESARRFQSKLSSIQSLTPRELHRPGLGPVEEDGFMQYRRPASKQGKWPTPP